MDITTEYPILVESNGKLEKIANAEGESNFRGAARVSPMGWRGYGAPRGFASYAPNPSVAPTRNPGYESGHSEEALHFLNILGSHLHKYNSPEKVKGQIEAFLRANRSHHVARVFSNLVSQVNSLEGTFHSATSLAIEEAKRALAKHNRRNSYGASGDEFSSAVGENFVNADGAESSNAEGKGLQKVADAASKIQSSGILDAIGGLFGTKKKGDATNDVPVSTSAPAEAPKKKGMSTGAKIAIGVVVAGIVGFGIYHFSKKKNGK